MSERIGIVAAAYAVAYATMRDWLNGFYGAATRSIASGIVCVIVAINFWSVLLVFNGALAASTIVSHRSASFITLIVMLTIVDLVFVETGKADRWAIVTLDRYNFLSRHRSKLLIGLIAITLINFMWSIQLN